MNYRELSAIMNYQGSAKGNIEVSRLGAIINYRWLSAIMNYRELSAIMNYQGLSAIMNYIESVQK
jgi:hypothetical protein